MKINKQIFGSILAAALLLGCNTQAMEHEQLKLITKITVDGKIGKMKLDKLSDMALEKLGGRPSSGSYNNEILIVPILYPTDFANHAPDELGLNIYNLNTKNLLLELDTQILNKKRNRFNFLNTTFTDEKDCPFLNFSTKKWVLQYDPIAKTTTQLKKKKQTTKKDRTYNICISFWDRECHSKINHHDYTVIINSDRNFQIMRENQDNVIIQSSKRGQEYMLFASPKKDSCYLVFHSGIPTVLREDNPGEYTQYQNTTILYDNKTGNPIINFSEIIPDIETKWLISATFGKNDDYIILAFDKELYVYDLTKEKITATYTFTERRGITRVILTKDEKRILVATYDNINHNDIYILENPLVKKDIDESERVTFIRKEKDAWLSEQDEEKQFKIVIGGIGGIKIPIEKCWFI